MIPPLRTEGEKRSLYADLVVLIAGIAAVVVPIFIPAHPPSQLVWDENDLSLAAFATNHLTDRRVCEKMVLVRN
jgi:hypothetical protein